MVGLSSSPVGGSMIFPFLNHHMLRHIPINVERQRARASRSTGVASETGEAAGPLHITGAEPDPFANGQRACPGISPGPSPLVPLGTSFISGRPLPLPLLTFLPRPLSPNPCFSVFSSDCSWYNHVPFSSSPPSAACGLMTSSF